MEHTPKHKTDADSRFSAPQQLRECYTLAAQYAAAEEVREVLQTRAERLSPGEEPPGAGLPADTLQQRMSRVMDALSGEHSKSAAASAEAGLMPDSPEKSYVLALLALQNGTSETNRTQAMNHLRAALAQAPNDPRYRTLAQILQSVSR